MRIVPTKNATVISFDTVLKHPENYIIVGVIKFNSCNYVYHLNRITYGHFVWVNVAKVGCLNKHNDCNDAKFFDSTEKALAEFLDGNEQHEAHAFSRIADYLEFLNSYLG